MKTTATVVLCDSEAGSSFARELAIRHCPIAWYSHLEELVRAQSFSSISVLIYYLHRPPKGILLATIGRMALSFPAIQKVAVLENPLSLVVVKYLTACGVDLIWMEPKVEKLDEIVAVVKHMRERYQWSLA